MHACRCGEPICAVAEPAKPRVGGWGGEDGRVYVVQLARAPRLRPTAHPVPAEAGDANGLHGARRARAEGVA